DSRLNANPSQFHIPRRVRVRSPPPCPIVLLTTPGANPSLTKETHQRCLLRSTFLSAGLLASDRLTVSLRIPVQIGDWIGGAPRPKVSVVAPHAVAFGGLAKSMTQDKKRYFLGVLPSLGRTPCSHAS